MYAYVHVDTSGCFRKLVPVFRGVVFIKTSKRLLINMAANIVNFAVVRYSYRDMDENTFDTVYCTSSHWT